MWFYPDWKQDIAGSIFLFVIAIMAFIGGYIVKESIDLNKKVTCYGIYETIELTKDEVVNLVYGNPDTTLIVMEH